MGIVYAARQPSLDRMVALKVLPQSFAGTANLRERFQREANATAKLRHPHIASLYGVGVADGVDYFAMDLIDGVPLSLRQLLDCSHGTSGSTLSVTDGEQHASVSEHSTTLSEAATPPAPPKQLATMLDVNDGQRWELLARLFADVCDAVHYAHGQGVLHRDIKPSNLMLDRTGRVWLMDFGLARVTDSDDLTETGRLIGTLRFIAPEVVEDGRVDALGDVYSLGLTMFELLALRPAFDATERPGLLQQVLTGDVPPLRKLVPGIPRDLETIVHKAISREPERRYASAGDLADDLRRFVEDRPIKARRTSPIEHVWRWCRRRPAVASLLLTVAIIVIGGIILAGRVRHERSERILLADQQAEALLERAQSFVMQVRQRRQLNSAMQNRAVVGDSATTRDVQTLLDNRLPSIQVKATDAELLTAAIEQAKRARQLRSQAGIAVSDQSLDEIIREIESELARTKFLEELDRVEFLHYGHKFEPSQNASFGYRQFWEPPQVSGRYAAAFELLGIKAGESTATEAEDRVGWLDADLKTEVIVALNRWSLAAHREQAPHKAWVAGVVEAVDADAWRQRMRTLAKTSQPDRTEADALLHHASFTSQDPRIAIEFQSSLPDEWDELRQQILERAVRIHPLSYGLNHTLAKRSLINREKSMQAVQYAAVANSLRRSRTSMAILGTMLERTKRFDEAIAVADQTLDLWPDDLNAGIRKAHYQARAGDVDGSFATLFEMAERHPKNASLYFRLARRLAREGRTSEAEAAYRRSIELADPPAWHYRFYAKLLRSQTRGEEAVGVVNAGLARHPHDGFLLLELHALLGELGRTEERAALTDRTVAALIICGQKCLGGLHGGKARQMFQAALSLAPGNSAAEDGLAKAKQIMAEGVLPPVLDE